jgi:shikimate kinase
VTGSEGERPTEISAYVATRAEAELGGRHVAMVGLMGTGKSTVGRLVAASLHRDLIDNDQLVAELGGPDVAAVLQTGGEPAIRSLESEVLRRQLSVTRPAVLAVAAGTVLSPDNRVQLAEHATVVWLVAPVDVLVDRLRGSDQRRPFVSDRADVEAVLAEQRDERSALYAQLADIAVDVSTATPSESAVAVLDGLARPPAS